MSGVDAPAIDVLINGQPCDVRARTLAELLAERQLAPAGKGMAVALNREVVPRALWATTPLQPGDRIEMIRVVVGG